MAEQKPPEDWLTQILDVLRPLLPRRFRSDIPLVPVVRLAGVIGFTTPLRPGLTLAGIARALERAFTMAAPWRSSSTRPAARRCSRI
jgi:serine protease SohB